MNVASLITINSFVGGWAYLYMRSFSDLTRVRCLGHTVLPLTASDIQLSKSNPKKQAKA